MNDESNNANELEEGNWVSRTEKKRSTENIQSMALALMKLSSSERNNLPLSDELKEAIVMVNKIKKNQEAYRRQMQLLSKILRDSDLQEIKKAMEKPSNLALKKLEMVRDEMLSNNDEIINNFLQNHPLAERQRLRQLIRQAEKEAKLEKPIKASKELLEYIKSVQS